MAKHFLPFTVVIGNIYPKSIRDLAEKLEVDVEDVAKSKGITPGARVKQYLRRDIIEMIDSVTENPDNPNQSILNFVNGTFELVDHRLSYVMARIDKFLGENVVLHHRLLIRDIVPPEMDEYEVNGNGDETN